MGIIKCKDLPYKRFELNLIETALKDFKSAQSASKNADDVLSARDKFLDVLEEYSTQDSLANTRYTLNSYDEFYRAEKEYYDEISPTVQGYVNEYYRLMLKCPYREELCKVLPITLFKYYECAIKSHSKEIEDDEREENALVTEYSDLMSQLTTDFRGEKRTISYIRGFLEDTDREVRRQAAISIGNGLKSVSNKLDLIYDKLVKVRTRMAKKLGYKNFVELGYLRMDRIDYDEEMVKSFRENVATDIVPVVSKIKNYVQKSLNLDKIYFYDNDVTEIPTAPVPCVQGEEILDSARRMYTEMSDVTGSAIDKMLSAEAFDTEARDGKWGGGYCTSFEKFKQPFILATFNGSSGDIDVVTHEFGHALADILCFEFGDKEAGIGSMETAETHSMSMEFFAWKYMDKFFNNPEEYKLKHLENCLTFIPYGVIVDEFQHIVYENPDMTPKERNDAYLKLEKKYRPYMTYEGIPYLDEGTRWQFQMHIYESPFYYIDYCLAQVIALEFLEASQKDYNEALLRYFDHVKRGGRYPFSELVRLANLKSPFEKGALKEVADFSLKICKDLQKI